MLFSRPYLRSRLCYSVASVCLSSVTLRIVAKMYVLEQKLLLTAYRKSYNEKSIGTKMNDLDFCLEVVSMSRQPLRYIRRWISRKPLDIEAWFQRTINRKWHMGYQMVTWPTTSRDPQRYCEAVRCNIIIGWHLPADEELIAWKRPSFDNDGLRQRFQRRAWRHHRVANSNLGRMQTLPAGVVGIEGDHSKPISFTLSVQTPTDINKSYDPYKDKPKLRL